MYHESKHVRKKRKRTRKLSDNRELLTSVVVMMVCGLVLVALVTYLLSTRACQAPRFLKSSEGIDGAGEVEHAEVESGSLRSHPMH